MSTLARGIEELLSDKELSAIAKKYDTTNPVLLADTLSRPRYCTGIIDYDLGLNGGFVYPGMQTIFGEPSGGKTYLCLRIIVSVQNTCSTCRKTIGAECECEVPVPGTCIYFFSEADWDPDWARAVGVDLENLYLVPNTSAGMTLDMMTSLARRRMVDLVVLDSMAFLSPKKEFEGSVIDENPGVQARLLGKFFRQFMTILGNAYDAWLRDPTVRAPMLLVTNHIRMKVGVMFGSPETRPGGKAPLYAAITETRMGKSSGIPKNAAVKNKALLRFKIVKNKSGPAYTAGEIVIYTMGDEGILGQVDDADRVASLAKKMGLIAREGKKWVCEGESFAKIGMVAEHLQGNLPMKLALCRKLVLLGR